MGRGNPIWGEETPEVEDIAEGAVYPDVYDTFLNAEISIWNEREEKRGRVVKCARGNDGQPIGRRHPDRMFNPEMGTREYIIEFEDGTSDRLMENIIARNIFSQVDAEGKRYTAIKEIVDHRKNRHTIDRDDGMIWTWSGQLRNKITTAGWELLVEYNDGSADWFKLKDLKDSNLIKLAEYAVANRISDEPSFVWCVPKIFRKRNRIIKKFKSRYWKVTHKFGVRLPHSIDKEFRVDRDTNTTFWTKAIKK